MWEGSGGGGRQRRWREADALVESSGSRGRQRQWRKTAVEDRAIIIPPRCVNGHPLTVFQIPSSWQIGTDTAQSSGLQPFSQKSRSPTVANEFQIGLYDPAEADLQLFCNSWSARCFGERLYACSLTLFNPVGCALRFSYCLQQFCSFFCETNSSAHLLQYLVPILFSFGRGPYSLVIAMLHASFRCKREERTTCPGGT